MKKHLLLLFTALTLFACKKTEAPVAQAAAPKFDNAEFQRQLDEMSAEFRHKYAGSVKDARLPRFITIFCADVLGGLKGVGVGAVLGTPGMIIGGVAGAVGGSIKAAESYAQNSNNAFGFSDKFNGAIRKFDDLNRYVTLRDENENPYIYYGQFHNVVLADLGQDFTGTEFRDEFNHGRIMQMIDEDAIFQPSHAELQAAGGEFTLADYQQTTEYFKMSDTLNFLLRANFTDPGAAYWQNVLPLLQADGAISANVAGYYRTFLQQMDFMTTMDQMRTYVSGFENMFLHNTTMPAADKEAMLKSLAVARYSMSFWYVTMYQ